MPRPTRELPPASVIRGMRRAGMTWKEIARDLRRSGYDEASRITLWRVMKHMDGMPPPSDALNMVSAHSL